MYKVISEVNAYLENLNNSGLADDIKKQYGGEAKFLRAMAYYNLVIQPKLLYYPLPHHLARNKHR